MTGKTHIMAGITATTAIVAITDAYQPNGSLQQELPVDYFRIFAIAAAKSGGGFRRFRKLSIQSLDIGRLHTVYYF